MASLYLLKGVTPTPLMRFRSYSDVSSFLGAVRGLITLTYPFTRYKIDDNTNLDISMKYLDITVNEQQISTLDNVDDIQDMTYLAVVDEDIHNTWFAFIDKVERNLHDIKSFRIYYTVDWWDNLMLWRVSANDYPLLYGKVVRAHVNDLYKVSSSDKARATLDYTLGEMEEVPNANNYTKKEVLYPFKNYTVGTDVLDDIIDHYEGAFLHLLVTSAFFNFGNIPNKSTASISFIRDDKESQKAIPSGLYEVVLPVDSNGNIVGYSLGLYYVGANVSVSSLRTDYIVAQYYTTFPPNTMVIRKYNSGSGYSFEYNGDRYVFDFGSNYFYTYPSSTASGLNGMLVPCSKVGGQLATFTPSLLFNDEGLVTNQKLYDKPSTYEDYLSQVTKYSSEIYNPLSIICNGSILTIHYSYSSYYKENTSQHEMEYACAVYLDGVSGTSLVAYSNYLDGYIGSFYVSDTNCLQPPLVADSYWDRYTANTSAVRIQSSTAGSVLGGIAGLAGSLLTGNIGAAVSSAGYLGDTIISNAAVNPLDVVKYHEYSNGGLQQGTTSSTFMRMFNKGVFPSAVYRKYDDKGLLERLVLYGYNTNLSVNEILTHHKRKYFNFIRTEGALLSPVQSTALIVRLGRGNTTEIVRDIQNMFNNGVWLFAWNGSDTFKFDVPNYPTSIWS